MISQGHSLYKFERSNTVGSFASFLFTGICLYIQEQTRQFLRKKCYVPTCYLFNGIHFHFHPCVTGILANFTFRIVSDALIGLLILTFDLLISK